MKRQQCWFDVSGDRCAATLDSPHGAGQVDGGTGLMIVSGGNEIRSGAHGGQAAMALYFAARNIAVFRYDRRGVGDSEGDNRGFIGSAEDIAAAVHAFRRHAPGVSRIVAFGNCDAASALALFHGGQFDRLLLANPWIIEADGAAGDNASPSPAATAIRARYWARIKNPRSIADLLTGKINLYKLAKGLTKAAAKEEISPLTYKLADALLRSQTPVDIMLAERDNSAAVFKAAWDGAAFEAIRARADITLAGVNSASHSFADDTARSWLWAQIAAAIDAPSAATVRKAENGFIAPHSGGDLGS